MNCKHVEELLPLYVGRDLEQERARLVTAHVRSCTQCARSAEEYGEASQLLQSFGPPQFSEATFAAVRSRVLREIEQESSAPTLLQILGRPFQPRFMWAVSTALLLAVCVAAYYFVANRTSGTQNGEQVAENPGAAGQNTRDEKKNAGPQRVDPTGTAGGRGLRPGSAAGVLDPPALVTSSPNPPLNLPAQNVNAVGRGSRPGSTAGVLDQPGLVTSSHKQRVNQTVWHSQRAGESSTLAGLPGQGPRPPAVPVRAAQDFVTGESKGFPNTSATSDKTLRLEIQTSNPNIRIIWFSHPPNTEGSPNESSKGL